MAQQETYGNWLGPKRLVRQAGIYSVAGKLSPLGNSRPASPDSFEDDYDDVSTVEPKGVYLLAGPPGPSPAPAPRDPQELEPNSWDSAQNSWKSAQNSRNSAQNSENLALNSWGLAPNPGNLAGNPGNSGHCRFLLPLALLAALSALAWGTLLLLALGKYRELRAELELLRSNLSGSWDSVQQEQTRLQFGIHQHQQQLQELTELLCRSPGSPRRCPPGWRSHGRSCYSFSRDALSWGSARDACRDLGAHLVVVDSEEEQMFLLESSERGRSFWLGVTDAEREGSWRWVTEEQPKLGFWDIWTPDPEVELKDCGALGPQGRWVSERCEEFHPWICEKPGNC